MLSAVYTDHAPDASSDYFSTDEVAEDGFIVQGKVNNIDTDVIIDSGAKISLLSSNFVPTDSVPISHASIRGVSQQPMTVPIHKVEINIPTLQGTFKVAVLDRLPPFTFLLGRDFGKGRLLTLMSSVKSSPVPVLAVTRAMAADCETAWKTAETLQMTEGAFPRALEDIPEVDETDIATSGDPSPSDSPSVDISDSPSVDISDSPSVDISESQALVPFPSLAFDGISKEQFKQLQKDDSSLAQLWDNARNRTNSMFIAKDFLMSLTSTANHISAALVVPNSLRSKVLSVAHDGHGHGGLNSTRALLNKHFTWPGMMADIREHISKCSICAKSNKSGGVKAPMLPPEIIAERCEKLAVDIVGPLPLSTHKFRFIFTAMELASGFPFAIPMKSYTAELTAQALLSVICFTGTPLVILSDQGSNFMSKVLTHLYKKLGISRVRTSPYHPQSNGRLERFHGTLKTMLTKLIDDRHNWPDFLDIVLFFSRNLPHTRHGYTPHELLFLKPTPFILSTLKNFWLSDSNANINLPQFIQELATQAACTNALVRESLSSKVAKSRLSKEESALSRLKVGSVVLRRVPGLNKCLESSWNGPFIITKLIHPVNCQIRDVEKKSKPVVVHVSQLKPVSDQSIFRVVSVVDDPIEDVSSEEPIALSADQQRQLEATLEKFPSVFADKPGLTNAATHSIRLVSSTPVWTPQYTVPISYQEAFRKELQSLLDLDIIEPSSSSWSSSPLPVRKKDGGIRIVVDFRKLNAITEPEPFMMPTVDHVIAQLGAAKFLSKLDLLKGFHQVPLTEESKPFTAFSCVLGKFHYRVMPFGLRNAPATFQLLMQRVLLGLESFCLAYIDDIIIYSIKFHDHIGHIHSVLERLAGANLTVKKSKCNWIFSSFEFLGFRVGVGSLSIPSARVSKLKSFLRPTTKSQLRSFLGLCNFYARFVPHFSSLMCPLYDLLKRTTPDKLPWSDDHDVAFRSVIMAIVNHSSLVIPSVTEARCVFSDASTRGVGGCLCVCRDDQWMPCAFFSRRLLPRETKFSATELEALALLETVEHFKMYLAGHDFVAYTDHQALLGVLEGVPSSTKLTRWKLKLAEYAMDVRYIKGINNPIADAMSRQGWPVTQDDASSV